jgi:hypothetical protein
MIENQEGRAKTLLDDELFKTVVEKQRSLYISNILNSAEDAVDERERSLLKLRGLDEFIASLQSIAQSKDIREKRWKIF